MDQGRGHGVHRLAPFDPGKEDPPGSAGVPPAGFPIREFGLSKLHPRGAQASRLYVSAAEGSDSPLRIIVASHQLLHLHRFGWRKHAGETPAFPGLAEGFQARRPLPGAHPRANTSRSSPSSRAAGVIMVLWLMYIFSRPAIARFTSSSQTKSYTRPFPAPLAGLVGGDCGT